MEFRNLKYFLEFLQFLVKKHTNILLVKINGTFSNPRTDFMKRVALKNPIYYYVHHSYQGNGQ